MRKIRPIIIGLLSAILVLSISACGQSHENENQAKNENLQDESVLEDGTYFVVFHTDSGMFHVNEAKNGKGILTVDKGKMKVHVSLASKKIVNLYLGTSEEAKNDQKNVIMPTTDLVTYDDGSTQEVYGFDIPVIAMDEEFSVAILGKKDKWYDHKVYVSDLEKIELTDGIYTPDSFTFSGGSGRVEITCDQIVIKDGQAYATIVFDSGFYSFVEIHGKKYESTRTKDSSSFEIPVKLNEENQLNGTTTKMSEAHEIAYSIYPMLSNQQEDMNSHNINKNIDEINLEESDEKEQNVISHNPIQLDGHAYEGKKNLEYATGFDVFYYEDGYRMIHVYDSAQYLLVPKNMPVPENLPEFVTVIPTPLTNTYLAATSAMSLFRSLDALDTIRLTGTKASGWYIEEAATAMKQGRILFAGKYSEPDYELLLKENCDLAIESTMILHSPKVKEMLNGLGIPVFTDYSSYEEHPLGRCEWIKLYGVLTDKEKQAEEFFQRQRNLMTNDGLKKTGKKVVFFSIDTDGTIIIRGKNDYIPKMIELAGGDYLYKESNIGNENSTSVPLSMEEFYVTAKDADFLIYNGTIEDSITCINDLIRENELFSDFKAVQEKNVYSVGKNLYQSTDRLGEFMNDLHGMLMGNVDETSFLLRLS